MRDKFRASIQPEARQLTPDSGCFKVLSIDMLCIDPILDALVKCVALVLSVNLTFIIVFIQFGASFTEKKFLYLPKQKFFILNVYLPGPC